MYELLSWDKRDDGSSNWIFYDVRPAKEVSTFMRVASKLPLLAYIPWGLSENSSSRSKFRPFLENSQKCFEV